MHLLTCGHADLTGNEFDRIFAEIIGGQAHHKPLGVVDVGWNGTGWSIKTVKDDNPHRFTVYTGTKKEAPKYVRLISGRNDPTFSAGIRDPLANIQKTGKAVVEIYSARIQEARKKYHDTRLLVLVRNMKKLEFTIFEEVMVPLAVNDYHWTRKETKEEEENYNLIATHEGEHIFTWQTHGRQFTVLKRIPSSATRFRLTKRPDAIPMDQLLD